MALLYLDSSALAKIYVRERGSELMTELASSDANYNLAICAITQVEFHSVISRRRREGDLDEVAVKRAGERFDDHLRNTFKRCPVDDRTLNLASVIVSRHALKASDAIQLAACLTLSGEARESLSNFRMRRPQPANRRAVGGAGGSEPRRILAALAPQSKPSLAP